MPRLLLFPRPWRRLPAIKAQQVPRIQDSTLKSGRTVEDPFLDFLDLPFASADLDEYIKEDIINRGKSAEQIANEEEMAYEEKKFTSYRRCWEDHWKPVYGSFLYMTVISPMHFTHSTPGRGLHDAACFAPTLQIFTLRLAGIKGGLEWPLSVYGVPETKLITIVTFSSLAIEASLKNSIKMLPFSSPYRTGAEGERRADERWVEEWLGRRWSRGGAAAMQGSIDRFLCLVEQLGSKREDTREGTRGLRI
ncbi:uncharacterized protein [Lolium perenne]|uniref:uncharacterized protein isoform X8 n=1 Tax=Lolium perenne TaxID=4522 RepID=UPI0021F5DD22|nr:uncharacterized protein LOC127345235 isoform X1 [Lolium perenne]XP_051227644.1 uncharacterized protein LOC127345235 isoform X1 [Lolium perenne]